jgi:hypothetical protein
MGRSCSAARWGGALHDPGVPVTCPMWRELASADVTVAAAAGVRTPERIILVDQVTRRRSRTARPVCDLVLQARGMD